jgi:hypothetical protein
LRIADREFLKSRAAPEAAHLQIRNPQSAIRNPVLFFVDSVVPRKNRIEVFGPVT